MAAGTAEASDYSIPSGQDTFDVTIAAGGSSGSGTFTLSTLDDRVAAEADALSITGSASGFTVNGASLTIGDSDAAAIDLSVDADGNTPGPQASLAEGVSNRSVKVTASAAGGASLEAETTVSVSVAAGTAEASDYSIPSGQDTFDVTIAAGGSSGSGTFTLTTLDDSAAAEADALSITGSTATAGLTITSASLTIGDSDAAAVDLSVDADGSTQGAQTSIAEGVSNRSVKVTAAVSGGAALESAATVSVAVGRGTAEASDYSIPSGQDSFDVTIAAGASSGSGTFTLTTNTDSVAAEADALSITGSASGFTVNSASLDIGGGGAIDLSVDADGNTGGDQTSLAEGISNRPVKVTASVAGGGTVEAETTIAVSISAGTAEAGDYSISAGQSTFDLVIAAGTGSKSGTFTLTTNTDAVISEVDALAVGGSAPGATVNGASLTITDDGTIDLSVDTDAGTEGAQTAVAEGAANRTVKVTAAVPGGGTAETETTVSVSVAAGTAEASDYSIPAGQDTFDLVIAAGTGSKSGTFTLTANTDAVISEVDALAVGGSAPGVTVNGASIEITGAGTIDLSVDADGGTQGAQTSIAEGISNRSVTVTATAAGGGTVEAETTVSVTVSEGTAEAGDYSIPSGQDSFDVTIAAGGSSGSGTFTLTTVDDSVVAEADALSIAGSTRTAGLTVNSAPLTLSDSDTAAVGLSVDADGGTQGAQTSIAEGVSNRSVKVTATVAGSLTVESDAAVSITVEKGTAESSDYSIPSGQDSFDVTIAAGGSSGSATFTLTTADDSVAAEADALSITGSTSAAGLTVGSASLTIGDSDAAAIDLSVDADGGTQGAQTSLAEGVLNRSVTVTAAAAGGAAVESDTTVSVAVGRGTAEASDYSIPSGQDSFDVTIAAGASSGSGTFTLTTNTDSVAAEADALSITGSASGFTVNPASLDIGGVGTIDLSVDADGNTGGDQTSLGEGISNRPVKATAAVTGGGTVEKQTTVSVSVAAGTAESSDYSIPSGQDTFDITIPAGGSSASQTFTLSTLDDNVTAEADALSVTGSTTAAGVTVSSASLTIGDSDAAAIGLSVDADGGTQGAQTSIAEGISNRSVTVTAAAAGGAAVESAATVSVTVGRGTAEASDYSVTGGSFDITIAAGTGSKSGTFTLTTNTDAVVSEADALAVGGTASGFTVNGASLTIGDSGTVDLTVDADSGTEGAQTSIAEGVSNRTVTVTAAVSGGGTAETDMTVSVSVGAGTAEESDYSVTGGSFDITIAAGTGSKSGTFTLSTTDDEVAGETDALKITGSASAAGVTVNSASLSIEDGDGAPTVIDLSVDADGGTQGAQTSLGEGISGRTVTVTAALAGSTTLAADTTVTVTVGSGTAESSDYSISAGQDSFDVTISAGASSGSATFTLTTNSDNVAAETDALSITGAAGDGFTVNGATLTITDAETVVLSVDADGGTPNDQTSIAEGITGRSVTVTAAVSGGGTVEAAATVSVVVAAGTAEASDYSLEVDGGGTCAACTAVADGSAGKYEDMKFDLVIAAGSGSKSGVFVLNTADDDTAGEADALSITGSTTAAGVSVSGASLTINDGDALAIDLSVDADGGTEGAQTSIDEGVSSRSVSVTAAAADSLTVEAAAAVRITVAAGTAEASDYSITAGEETFDVEIAAGAGSGSGSFTLTTANDNVAGESDVLAVSGASGSLTVNGASLTINDADTADTIDLSVDKTSIREGQTETVTVTAQLADSLVLEGAALSVPVVIQDGSTNGSADYTATPSSFSLTIAAGAGSESGTFTLAAASDNLLPEDEAVMVAGGSLAGYTINSTAVSITDVGRAVLRRVSGGVINLSVDADPAAGRQTSIAEGITNREVTVTAAVNGGANLSAETTISVSVGAGTAEADDYTIPAGEETFDVVIAAGSSSGSGTFTITTNTDRLAAEADALSITGSTSVVGFTINAASLAISDSETVDLSVDADGGTPGAQTSIAEGVTNRTVTVTASVAGGVPAAGNTTISVSVGAGTAESSDYTIPAGEETFDVVIAAGSSSGSGTFTLSTADDKVSAEADALSISGSSAVSGLTVNSASLTIGDSDATIDLSVDADGGTPGAQTSIAEGITGRTVTVTASLPGNGTAEAEMTVSVSAAAGTAEASDYSIPSGQDAFDVTIAAGASSGSGTFTLTTNTDSVTAEDDALSITGSASGFTVNSASLTIGDSGTVNLSVDADGGTPNAQTSIAEGATNRTVTVTASVAGGATVEAETTISVSAAAGTAEASDYSIPNGEETFDLVIPAGGSSKSGTFTLSTTDDNVTGEADALSIGGSTAAAGLTVNSASLTIGDSDAAVIDLSVDADSASGLQNKIAEGVSNRTVKVTATVAGSLTVEAAATVRVSVGAGTAESSDYSIPSGQDAFDVTIAAGGSSGSGTFTLTANTDTRVAEEDALSITGSASGFTVNAATLTIVDSNTVDLSVDADGGTSGVQTSIAEGVDDRTVTVTATVAGGGTVEAETTISVSVAAGTAESSDYSISSGEDSFDVTISAGGSSASGTFTLTTNTDSVTAEADALSITGSADGFTVNGASLTIGDSGTVDLSVDADGGTPNAQTSIAEGAANRTVTVTASVAGGATVEGSTTISVSVGAGTAESSDYSIPNGGETFDLVIPAGGSSKSGTFTLSTADDNVTGEADALSIGGSTAAAGLTVNSASLTIGDSDTAAIDLAVDADSASGNQDSIGEGVTNRTVKVTATVAGSLTVEADTTISVSVGQGTAEASDYSIPTGQHAFDVVIAAGAGSKSGTFPLTTNDDTVVAEDDVLTVGGAAQGFTVTGASLTITGAGAIGLSVDADGETNGAQTSIAEGAANRTVTVTAAVADGATVEGNTTISVTVGRGTAEASDYSIPSGEDSFDVTIAAGGSSGSATFTLSTADDRVVGEADALSISGSTAAAGITVSPASLEIADSDPTIVLSVDADGNTDGNQATIAEGAANRSVRVTAAASGGVFESETTVRVSVGRGTAESSDYMIPSGQESFDITIAAGAGSKSAAFTLTAYTDNVVAEADALSIGGAASGFTVTPASLTITGSGTIALSVDADGETNGAQTAIAEGAANRTVTVTAAAPGGVVESDTTVSVSVSGGTAQAADYSIPDGEETFDAVIAAGGSSASGSFTLSTTDDNVAGETEALSITGSTAAAGINVTPASLTITDGDAAPTKINLSLDDSEVSEGQSERITITAGLAGNLVLQTSVTVAVAVTADGSTQASDYTASPTDFDIVIPAGQNSKQGSFLLTAKNDDIAGENDRVKVTGTASGFTFNDPLLVNIGDTDPDPSSILLSADRSSVNEGETQTVKVTAAFNGAKWADTTMVKIQVAAGTAEADDYQVDRSTFTVTINKETQQAAGTFRLTANQDTVQNEGDESIRITGSDVGGRFTVGSDSVTIADASAGDPPITVTPPENPPTVEEPPVVDPPPPPPTTVDPPPPPPPPADPPADPPRPGGVDGPPAPAAAPSTDASLRSLAIAPGVLSPAFAPAALAYTTEVSARVWTVQVNAVPNDPKATVRIGGKIASGSQNVSVGTGDASISVLVTAEDGITTRTYRVAVGRGAGAGFADALPSMSACVGPALRRFGFKDVEGWFSEQDINCIGYYGITLGRTPTRYSPEEVVSRWQMALFLYRAATPAGIELPAPRDQGFTDIAGRSERDREAINMMAQLGVMPGRGGRFDPDGPISRADMSLMLDAFLGLVTVGEGGIARDSVDPDPTLFEDIGELTEREQLAIRRIFEMGVTRGSSATAFKPAAPVTRAQMARFIARTLAHTMARPIGVSIQSDPSTLSGGRVNVVVSVRGEDFGAVSSARVDLFTAADRDAAFADDGTCAAGQVSKAGPGARVCAVDSGDPATGANGDLSVSIAYRQGTTVWAWRGALDSDLDDTTTTAELTF